MQVPRASAIAGAALIPLGLLAAPITSVGHANASPRTPVGHVATAASHKLEIMVTNDDGYNAPGIAAISSALAKLPSVHVVVVAPLTNQSGTGGNTTKGHLRIKHKKTLNGMPAYAVDGYPADTVRAALDELHLHPNLVVSGINAGQNLGPVVDLSGTIGAARAAVARGIPAVAASSGLGTTIKFNAAIPFVRHWIMKNRASVLAATATVHVLSFNVPSCQKGSVRGLAQEKPDLNTSDIGQATGSSDCLSKKPPGNTDVKAFSRGFATESVVPAKPATS